MVMLSVRSEISSHLLVALLDLFLWSSKNTLSKPSVVGLGGLHTGRSFSLECFLQKSHGWFLLSPNPISSWRPSLGTLCHE